VNLPRPTRATAIPWVVGLGIAAIHLTLAVVRYANFDTASWDLGIFTQAINNYAHFRAPIADIHGPGFNVLGDHFSPALAVLAPLFWIWQSPVVLLAAQAIAFGWSAVPITRLGRERLGAWTGTALGVAYGLSAGLLHATRVDFHEVAFAVPLLAYALVAVVEERWRAVAWCALPLLLVKEDLGFTVSALGLLLILRGARRIGILLAVAGIAGSALAVFALIPILAPGHRYAYFSQYDSAHAQTGFSAVWGAFAPSRWTAGFGTKVHTLLALGTATAFAGLGSSIALVALPTLGWRFVSAQSLYWGTTYHYDAVLMPIMFVAAIEACARWSQTHGFRHWFSVVAPVAALVISTTYAFSSPLHPLFQRATWTTTPLQRAEAAAVRVIPENVTVLTDLGVMSHLVARDHVYWLGNSSNIVPAYVVSAIGGGWTPPAPEAAVAYWNAQYSGHQFRLIFYADGVSVLQRIR